MKNFIKNASIVSIILIIVFGIYYYVVLYLKKYYISNLSDCSTFKNNEFGDFIGGITNPLFTLLSTVSIIYLTYILAKAEDVKAEKAIETQKRITLNQMRQSALENLIQKTNLYVYESDKLAFHTAKNLMHQKILTGLIKQEEKDQQTVVVWLIILSELENFTQLKYLFAELFKKKEFTESYESLIKITSKMCEEQAEMNFVESKTLEKYIENQQNFLTIIGNYIYSEF